MAIGLRQDTYRNRFGGVAPASWGGIAPPTGSTAGGPGSRAYRPPAGSLSLGGGGGQDLNAGSLPANQDAGQNAINAQLATGNNSIQQQQQNAPPPLAPTSEQVRSSPNAWAGTSFDPSRNVGSGWGPSGGANNVGVPDPQWAERGSNDPALFNTYDPINGNSPNTPQWVRDSQREGGEVDWNTPAGYRRQLELQGGGEVSPMDNEAAIQSMGITATNDPNIYQTSSGATLNRAPRDQSEPYDAWLRRVYGAA